MNKVKILSALICAVLLISCFASCDEVLPEVTTEPTAEQTPEITETDTDTEKLPETDSTTTQEATTEEVTTEEITTEEVTTAAPEPEIEPMQIPEYYKIGVTTEFPLIATLGGEKVDVTVRAATLRSKFDVRWVYIDVLRDKQVICTKLFRAAAQLMATTTKTEYFAILRVSDSISSGMISLSYESYRISDEKGKVEITYGGGLNNNTSLGFYEDGDNPMTHPLNRDEFRIFLHYLKVDEFQKQNGDLCMVLDNLSDQEKDVSAYPADALPIYRLDDLNNNPFFSKLREEFLTLKKLTSIFTSLETIPPEIPEGMSMVDDSLRCSADTVTVDGINYKLAIRTFALQDAQGNPCGTYRDVASYYDMSVVSVEITQ